MQCRQGKFRRTVIVKQLVSGVVFLLLSAWVIYSAVAPQIQRHKGHGTYNGDHVRYGLQTSDGGYIILTDSDTAGDMGGNDFVLMKIAMDK